MDSESKLGNDFLPVWVDEREESPMDEDLSIRELCGLGNEYWDFDDDCNDGVDRLDVTEDAVYCKLYEVSSDCDCDCD